MNMTLFGLLQPSSAGEEPPVLELFESKLSAANVAQEKSLSPNLIEEIKLLVVCLSLVSH